MWEVNAGGSPIGWCSEWEGGKMKGCLFWPITDKDCQDHVWAVRLLRRMRMDIYPKTQIQKKNHEVSFWSLPDHNVQII